MEFVKFNSELSVSETVTLAKELTGSQGKDFKVNGDENGSLTGVAHASYGIDGMLCFVERLSEDMHTNNHASSLVITNPECVDQLHFNTKIVVDDPRALFIDLLSEIREMVGLEPFSSLVNLPPDVDALAVIHPSAIIEKDVVIGSGTTIGAGCVIKSGTCIGENVVIRENTVIGCDGITVYKAKDGRRMRFPHLTGVIVEDGVEIGAGCVLPRGMLSSSIIGSDTVIGNLSNIGHGVTIGKNVWMSVGALIGGNTKIGDSATIGLGVCIRDNISIGRGASVAMGAVVVKAVPENGSVFGNPAKRIPSLKAGPER